MVLTLLALGLPDPFSLYVPKKKQLRNKVRGSLLAGCLSALCRFRLRKCIRFLSACRKRKRERLKRPRKSSSWRSDHGEEGSEAGRHETIDLEATGVKEENDEERNGPLEVTHSCIKYSCPSMRC